MRKFLFIIGLCVTTNVTAQEENVVYKLVDKQPEAKVGTQKFPLLLRDNIRYPQNKSELEGTAFVEFVVEKDGAARTSM